MLRFKNNRKGNLPNKERKDELSRVQWFLFVHRLMDRFESGEISKKEEQLLSQWHSLSAEEGPTLPDEKDVEDSGRKIYERISKQFSTSIHSIYNVADPIYYPRRTGPSILHSFPLTLLIIIIIGMGGYFLSSRKSLFTQLNPEKLPAEYIEFNTQEVENKQSVFVDEADTIQIPVFNNTFTPHKALTVFPVHKP